MPKKQAETSKLTFHWLTPERWEDVEKLFGANGACGGCWCMAYRLSSAEFHAKSGLPNKRAFKKLVQGENLPGILAYDGKEPVGWCSVAPREEFVRFETSRVLKPVDDQPVWSVTCFFIAKPYRMSGLSVQLLKAACEMVKKRGGKIVEGYPFEVDKKTPDAFVWFGTANAFRKAGFKEVERRSKPRPIMRYVTKK